jgi:hypothetical protein
MKYEKKGNIQLRKATTIYQAIRLPQKNC